VAVLASTSGGRPLASGKRVHADLRLLQAPVGLNRGVVAPTPLPPPPDDQQS
jgi:hypothetical protein